jgi:Fic family protein
VQPADFTQDSPGTLTTTESGAWAFVPQPLPEGVELDDAAVQLLGAAEYALGRLDGSVGRLIDPLLVGRPLLRREAILSSRIEGTYTTPRQLALLEAAGDDIEDDGDTREVLNYASALKQGLRRLEQIPVCLRLIRELHAVLLSGVRGDAERPGEFRTVQNYIGARADGVQGARFVPPPPGPMRECLQDLERYLNPPNLAAVKVPLLVRIALSHYQFETIHPFRDGNGRVGRLLIPLLLHQEKKLSSPTLYLSAYFERHRDQYVDLMLRISQRGDWMSWIHFFLRGVEQSASESGAKVTDLLELRARYHSRFQAARSSALLLKLVDALFERQALTVRQAAEHLGVTVASAGATVEKLCTAGILEEATGKKRDRIYVAPGILALVDDAAT